MQFYHSLVTEKSYEFLQDLKRSYKFILIGGWAVYLYTRALKSKDIDIIVNYDELAKLREKFDVFKNNRLKKYEIKTGEFDIDIYLPHYSELGIDAEVIQKKSIARKGFVVPELEILFLLKLYAWGERRGSAKGRKDELDIFSLIFLPEFDSKKYLDQIKKIGMDKLHKDLVALIKNTSQIKELGINEQKMAKLKKIILKQCYNV
jgi:hypothetical protein